MTFEPTDAELKALADALYAVPDHHRGEWYLMARAAIAALPDTIQRVPEPFQSRVKPWMDVCFGPQISADRVERNDRFIEEALELTQATGYTAERAHALVDYVYSRPIGESGQEVGGVMVTLAAHCLAHGLDMHAEAETELARIWTKIEKIRAKQAAKPTGLALPIEAATSQFQRVPEGWVVVPREATEDMSCADVEVGYYGDGGGERYLYPSELRAAWTAMIADAPLPL